MTLPYGVSPTSWDVSTCQSRRSLIFVLIIFNQLLRIPVLFSVIIMDSAELEFWISCIKLPNFFTCMPWHFPCTYWFDRHRHQGPVIAVIECPNIQLLKSGIRALEDFPCVAISSNVRDSQYQVIKYSD